jgi:hypothetical protein
VPRLLDRRRPLRNLGQAPQPRELGGQLEILGDEALILALKQQADPALYELLALIDAVRDGRVRERQLAEKELSARLQRLLRG